MIAIKSLVISNSPDASCLFYGPHGIRAMFNQHYADIIAFYQKCVDDNIILNLVKLDDQESPTLDTTIYYATTMEKALEAQRRCQDTSQPFCLETMKLDNGYRSEWQFEEVDFDTVDGLTYLVDQSANTLLGLAWPADPEETL